MDCHFYKYIKLINVLVTSPQIEMINEYIEIKAKDKCKKKKVL
jgi:hypothetical protein